MKITRLLLAAAATLMLTTSCEAFLDSIAKNPIFTFTGTTVYDGQSAYLGLTATCKVGWETNRPDTHRYLPHRRTDRRIPPLHAPDDRQRHLLPDYYAV